jgi:hypothetical protein
MEQKQPDLMKDQRSDEARNKTEEQPRRGGGRPERSAVPSFPLFAIGRSTA